MKKILIFSRDPGAANTVIPVYKALISDGRVAVSLYGKDFALERYSGAGLESTDIVQKVRNTKADFELFLAREKYDMIITGTTSDDDTDRLLWRVAAERNIPTLAILDSWMHYLPRFQITNSGGEKDTIFPTTICVMDEKAKEEMVKQGFPESKLIVTGQPYFETIIETIGALSQIEIIQATNKLGIDQSEKVIIFASEPIIETFSDPMHLGYNQITILDKLTSVLTDYAESKKQKIILVIKLHPRNDKSIFSRYVTGDKRTAFFRVVIEESMKPQLLIGVADSVIGMASMFLLEAGIARKPFLSVQIGLKQQDPFILSRMGMVKAVVAEDDLNNEIASLLESKIPTDFGYQPVLGATKNILRLVFERLV